MPVKQPNRALSENKQIAVCAKAIESRRMPTSKIAKFVDISKTSAWKILKREKFFAYNFYYFTDESTFYIDKTPNRQNVRFWARHNPREYMAIKTQYKIAVNV